MNLNDISAYHLWGSGEVNLNETDEWEVLIHLFLIEISVTLWFCSVLDSQAVPVTTDEWGFQMNLNWQSSLCVSVDVLPIKESFLTTTAHLQPSPS